MRKGAGKQKGNNFERQVSKLLSKWITGDEKKECFWRSANSGAKATIGRKKGISSNQDGDITSTSVDTHWLTHKIYIECKNYSKLEFLQCMQSHGNIWEWWLKCRKEAYESKKEPMLIFKGNRTPIYGMVNTDLWFTLYHYTDISSAIKYIRFNNFDYDVFIFLFNDFLDLVDPEIFRKMLNNPT